MRTILFIIILQFSPITCAKSIAQHSPNEQQTRARIAIVIDDIGYRKTDSAVLNLPGRLTLSILPHTPYGKKLAKQAFQADHDIMLHIPMESENGKLLGPGALTIDMDEQALRASLASSYHEIPFAIGINNHMGSRLTQMYKPMAWTMRFLKDNNLLFLDSLTSNKSKAGRVARAFDVPELSRNIFLDNQLEEKYIEQQFYRLIWQARHSRSHTAIAIAHPHPETVKALTLLIPRLAKENIKLVPISALLMKPPLQKLAKINSK
jgi:hypothetical protein